MGLVSAPGTTVEISPCCGGGVMFFNHPVLLLDPRRLTHDLSCKAVTDTA